MTSGNFLARMAAASRSRVTAALARQSRQELAARAADSPPAPRLNLTQFDLIAEVKQRSPAAGNLSDAGFDLDAQVAAYANGGAAAISVLTEPDQFLGSLADLEAASNALRPMGTPTMRKDFLVDDYQLLEARPPAQAAYY